MEVFFIEIKVIFDIVHFTGWITMVCLRKMYSRNKHFDLQVRSHRNGGFFVPCFYINDIL